MFHFHPPSIKLHNSIWFRCNILVPSLCVELFCSQDHKPMECSVLLWVHVRCTQHQSIQVYILCMEQYHK